MTMIFKTSLTIFAAIALGACSAHTQLTSGNDYLMRSPSLKASSASALSSGLALDINSQVLKIAAVEPELRFPARIGLARISRGQLSNSPADELMVWSELADRLGPQTGEFIPVSPFIADMVRPDMDRSARNNVVDDIRRASARQHLDYALVYEVTGQTDNNRNALSFTDLTVLGLFVIPSRNVKVDSAASALLLDVRNGYPYGTASAFAQDESLSTSTGARAKGDALKAQTNLKAVENLSGEVETMVRDLQAQLAVKGES